MTYQTRACSSLVDFQYQCEEMGGKGYTLHSWHVIKGSYLTYVSMWYK